MIRQSGKRLQSSVLSPLLSALLLLALTLRALVPVGYMPAELSSGWPVQLCPTGLTPQIMQALLGDAHQHHGQHHGEATNNEQPSDCNLAAFSAALTLPEAIPLLVLTEPFEQTLFVPGATALVQRTRASYRSRAPPV